MNYDPKQIESKWQEYWEKKELNKAEDFSKKEKVFLLVEFPYPSGAGLHVGHCRSYTAMDIIARKRRMEGYNVLFPMGWDAFGLPSENYAVKTGVHPSITTKENAENFKKQEKMLGFSFDWSREINTTDPAYYKWTQWIFLKLFEHGLAYKARIPINWCLSCKIGLANEEVVDGKCERCGGEIEKREKDQWLIKITEYAERLIKDLDLVDFPDRVKILQKDWIGRSEGWEIKFQIANCKLQIEVFTTRIDTIFGCTYLVVAPEHSIISNLKLQIANWEEVEEYIEKTKKKSERDRQSDVKDKTGVKLEGIVAINPANGKEIPIFVADYVLVGYGTGAIMAVPAQDQRDFDFAKKFNLLIVEAPNSMEMAEKGIAKKQVNYKLRDWVFSRQRYWGEPIPLVFCLACKKQAEISNFQFPISKQKGKEENFSKGEILNPGWIAINEKDLPVELPNLQDFKPMESGESPLAKALDWINVKCPKCKGEAKRETDVMPNWAGSNWYFMRYCDPNNDKEFVSKEKLKYFMPVDWYNGGMEHTTLHLLYSRFIYKFLWDIGEVPKEIGPEPYKKRTSHGMILGEGGIKMSKSKGNVINPEDVIKEYGADTLRIYEMFMGPFDQAISWDTKSLAGARRFLEKIYKQKFKVQSSKCKVAVKGLKLEKLLHQTIKKVSDDIEAMKFNTAVSALMILVNAMEKEQEISSEIFAKFLLILSPFAPHLAEELWQTMGEEESIFLQEWPKYDENLIKEDMVKIIVQVNGKARETIEASRGISQKEVEELAKNNKKVLNWLASKEIKKVVFVQDKLINFVV